MMAARFSSVYWVALASIAGLACYMVTQRVAAERTTLESIERGILQKRLSIRSLETELGTRANMAQLERWNQDVLDLRAANATQFVPEGVQLASLSATPLPGVRPAVAGVVPASTAPSAAPRAAAEQSMVRPATYVRPPEDRVAPAADPVVRTRSPLGAAALADLNRLAHAESASVENDRQ